MREMFTLATAIAVLISACTEEETFTCPEFERPLHTELRWSYIPPGTFMMGAGPEAQTPGIL